MCKNLNPPTILLCFLVCQQNLEHLWEIGFHILKNIIWEASTNLHHLLPKAHLPCLWWCHLFWVQDARQTYSHENIRRSINMCSTGWSISNRTFSSAFCRVTLCKLMYFEGLNRCYCYIPIYQSNIVTFDLSHPVCQLFVFAVAIAVVHVVHLAMVGNRLFVSALNLVQ